MGSKSCTRAELMQERDQKEPVDTVDIQLELGQALGSWFLSADLSARSTSSHHQNCFPSLCIVTWPGPLTASHKQGGRDNLYDPRRTHSSPTHTQTWKLNLRTSMTFQIQQVMRSKVRKWSEAGEWHAGAILKHTSVAIPQLWSPWGDKQQCVGRPADHTDHLRVAATGRQVRSQARLWLFE